MKKLMKEIMHYGEEVGSKKYKNSFRLFIFVY